MEELSLDYRRYGFYRFLLLFLKPVPCGFFYPEIGRNSGKRGIFNDSTGRRTTKKPIPEGTGFSYQFTVIAYSATTSNSISTVVPLPKSIAALWIPSSFTSSRIEMRLRSIS